jgi:hypothetical protein
LRYYFSGIDPRYGCVFEHFPHAGLMFSASTLLRPSMFALFESCLLSKRQIVLDSGITQGWVPEDAYIELLDAYGQCFRWFAHYDQMHAFYLSNGNYNYARDFLGKRLWGRLLYVLQGRPQDGFTEAQYRAVMRVLTRATSFVGVGGLARLCRQGQFEVIERYLDGIYERLGLDICQWIHLFGIGNHRLLSRYRALFGSADSSTWLCGVRGELLQPDGTRRRCEKPFDKLLALRQNVETLLRWAEDWPALFDEPCQQRVQPPYRVIPATDPSILETMPKWGGEEVR